jgi:hypothetical protein
MAERSGIDMLEELLAEIQRLNKKIDIMDIALKKIANSAKIGQLANRAFIATKQIEAVDPEKLKKKNAVKPGYDKCICSGRITVMAGGKKVPVNGIIVTIFNDKDEMVKQTKTNRGGDWISHLLPGKYVALCEGKFNGSDLYPINLNFEVKQGMKNLKVDQ